MSDDAVKEILGLWHEIYLKTDEDKIMAILARERLKARLEGMKDARQFCEFGLESGEIAERIQTAVCGLELQLADLERPVSGKEIHRLLEGKGK